jgi:hypothetical protein
VSDRSPRSPPLPTDPIMIRPSDTPPGPEHLLFCSTERTLVRTVDAETGTEEVHKILLRGSLADAERELDVAAQLHGLDVVDYLGAGSDPTTGRPVVRMRMHRGVDLERLVARDGAMPTARALALLAPVAHTLAVMHERMLCHGDVKPANVLATDKAARAGQEATPGDLDRTLLLDLEHCAATGSARCAGTPGFAGPEARQATALHPSFDVYGIGATLTFLLGGHAIPDARRRRSRLFVREDVGDLINRCMASLPDDRPSMRQIAADLERLRDETLRDEVEACRDSMRAGDSEAAARRRPSTPPPLLDADLERSQRLVRRLQPLLDGCLAVAPQSLAPSGLTRQIRRLSVFLMAFPAHSAAVQARKAAVLTAAHQLPRGLERTTALLHEQAFGRALTLVEDLDALAATTLACPGSLPATEHDDARMPSLLARAPRLCLQQERRRIETERQANTDLLEQLRTAEAALQLTAAEVAVDRLAAQHGGSSQAVARQRDRLHQLAFYVERIARSRPTVERLHELAPEQPLTELNRCVLACADAACSLGDEPGQTSLRQLQIALQNTIHLSPAIAPRLSSGLRDLEAALAHITAEAWRLLDQAQQQLAAEPVPVLPLRTLLSRLDTFRAADSLVDLESRSRNALLDRIEDLRLQIDQAQATRDRLARGAEDAMARGHWTTGLFDMERAVSQLQDESPDDGESERLKQRLAEARRRKREIERAQHRNVELAQQSADQADDVSCTYAERLHVLRQRRDCLQFLATHQPADRSELYARDLQDVEIAIAQALAEQAEEELDQTQDHRLRLRLAQQTLERLATAGQSNNNGELPGRLRRLLDHWQRRIENEQRELANIERLVRGQRRHRRRMLATLAAAAATIALTMLWWPGLPAHAGSGLRQQAASLTTPMREPALQLVDLIEAASTRGADQPNEWLRDIAQLTMVLLSGDAESVAMAAAAWDAALAGAWQSRAWQSARGERTASVDATLEVLRAAGLPR